MTKIRNLDSSNFDSWILKMRRPFHAQYYAMYSSVYAGIVTDPLLMMVPVDDHMVHRGDAVFETLKCVGGNIYNMDAHLDRLASSARGLSLDLPCSEDELAEIVVQTVFAGGHPDCLVRLLLSRGPGSLGVSPYDCPSPALYVVVSEYKKPFMELHPEGARAKASALPVKAAPFANLKSVNYLTNVLMKKEAVDAEVDFVVSFDENGHLAEGPTENAGIVTRHGRLCVPRPDRILAGTTMLRVMDLARDVSGTRQLAAAEAVDITREDVAAAAEMLIFGTTPDVTAVVEFDGKPVGNGKPGPIFKSLSRLLADDIHQNVSMQTRVF
jgi:branched-subunit amino acid aminotransferase/4-amino-4-deoxychorismate lyase